MNTLAPHGALAANHPGPLTRPYAEVVPQGAEFDQLVERDVQQLLTSQRRGRGLPRAHVRAHTPPPTRYETALNSAFLASYYGGTMGASIGGLLLCLALIDPGAVGPLPVTPAIAGLLVFLAVALGGSGMAISAHLERTQKAARRPVITHDAFDRLPQSAQVAYTAMVDAPGRLLAAEAPETVVADAVHRCEAALEAVLMLRELDEAGGTSDGSQTCDTLVRAAAETLVVVEAYETEKARTARLARDLRTETVNEVIQAGRIPHFPQLGRDEA